MTKILLQLLATGSLLSGTAFLQAVEVVRGPYLQETTQESVVIRWRTDVAADTRISIFDLSGPLLGSALSTNAMEHSFKITGLQPSSSFRYRVDDASGIILADSTNQHFTTAPAPGTPGRYRVWVIGDSGTANDDARAVRDAYEAYTGDTPTDVWLMLGDNAYTNGTDAEYQSAVFEMYTNMLPNTSISPTQGNHERTAGVYGRIFDMPVAGEAGGIPSGTELYYSFDYGNVHFICLDSYSSDRSATGAMANWLQADLAATTNEWIITYFHHPPYTKGSHDSDNPADSLGSMFEMRQNILPILEQAGVDLVLSGHSHSYERSNLIGGHYGDSTTFDPATMLRDGGDGAIAGDGPYRSTNGTVYAVAGSSGKVTGTLTRHPVMENIQYQLGSMVLDIHTNKLDAIFLDSNGLIRDRFQLLHPDGDDDDDGLPDAWELQYFSNLTVVASTSTSDSDGDGITDVEEYISETSPIDATSFLRLFIETTADTTNLLSWAAAPGRTYSLEATTNLLTGPWNTVQNNLSSGQVHHPIGPRFRNFRIRINPQP